MGCPKRKIVPINGDNEGSSGVDQPTNRLIDCLSGQLNGQLGNKLPVGFNSLEEGDVHVSSYPGEVPILRSRNHKILLAYLSSRPVWLTTNQEISEGSGLRFETVRYGLRKLEAIGCIAKSQYSNCGLKIEVIKTADELGVKTKHSNLTVRADKIDRLYNKSIYLSQNDIDRLWPLISDRGFLAAQYRQLVQDFEAKDFEVANIKQALNYVEFQLSHKSLVDQYGNPVDEVPAYLMKALLSNGYYSRPRNYVSPEEHAEIELLNEEKRIAALRIETLKLRELNWWEGLESDHPAKIDKMMGSLESWISYQYQRYAGGGE